MWLDWRYVDWQFAIHIMDKIAKTLKWPKKIATLIKKFLTVVIVIAKIANVCHPQHISKLIPKVNDSGTL